MEWMIKMNIKISVFSILLIAMNISVIRASSREMRHAIEASEIDEAIRLSKIDAEKAKEKKRKEEQEKKDRKMAQDLQHKEEQLSLEEAKRRSLNDFKNEEYPRERVNYSVEPSAPLAETFDEDEGSSQAHSLYPDLSQYEQKRSTAPVFSEHEIEVRQHSRCARLCAFFRWIASYFCEK